MMSLKDYRDLPVYDSFADIFSEDVFTTVPGGWYIIVCDIKDSTTAVRNGQYKEVNMAGAAAVSVAGNIIGHLDFPFVFGGDGIAAVLPKQETNDVLSALVDLQQTVQRVYGLRLRVGAIAVNNLPSGPDLYFARLRVGKKFVQAIFAGNGIMEAEGILKAGGLDDSVVGRSGTANTAGISCRWKDIPSRSGETYTLIVHPLAENLQQRFEIVRKVWNDIALILGKENSYHPVQNGIQRMINNREEMSREVSLQNRSRKGFRFWFSITRVRMESIMASLVIRLHIPFKMYGKKLSDIPDDNIIHADFRKFDGQLKAVLACDSQQRKDLDSLLSSYQQNGMIVYGRHISDRAVITCLIHVSAEQEVHFIDGGDGGYTLAAAQLKDCL